MSARRAAGSAIAGVVATAVLGVATIVLLPLLGFGTAEVVGDWLPVWLFSVPVFLCPIAGGAITGFLQGTSLRRGAVLGGLAAALPGLIFGVIFGLVFLLLLLGMTPAHGPKPDLSRATLTMVALGGGAGFVAGAFLGSIGGVGGHVGRQELGR